MKRNRYIFYIKVYASGTQQVSSFSHSGFTNQVVHILGQCHGSGNLKWFKGLLHEALESGEKKLVSINTLVMYVDRDVSEIGYEGEEDQMDTVATSEILEYVDDAIEFVLKYENGDIPGLDPPDYVTNKKK